MTVVFNQFLNLMLDENLYQAGTSCAGTDANKAVCVCVCVCVGGGSVGLWVLVQSNPPPPAGFVVSNPISQGRCGVPSLLC